MRTHRLLRRGLVIAVALALAGCSGGQAPVVAEFGGCAGCHADRAGAGQRLGPNLSGVVGRSAGTMSGYAYSAAMRNSGIIWSEPTLNAFLADPTGVVPGTRMQFAVNDPAERQKIIAHLKSISK